MTYLTRTALIPLLFGMAGCTTLQDRRHELAVQAYNKMAPQLEESVAFMAYEVVSKGGFPQAANQTVIFRSNVMPKLKTGKDEFEASTVQVLANDFSPSDLKALSEGRPAADRVEAAKFVQDMRRLEFQRVATVFTNNQSEFKSLGFDDRVLTTYGKGMRP